MEIGAAVEGLTAVLALNSWALLITGVVTNGAIIYKTWSDTQANLERGYEDMRRQSLPKDKPDDVKKLGYPLIESEYKNGESQRPLRSYL